MRDDETIDCFVASNAPYYRAKWKKFHEKPGSVVSFNLAASLGQIVWLAYRKLYVALFRAVVTLVAYVTLWLWVEERQLVPENLSAAWNSFVALILFAVFGFKSNYGYWRRFQKVERQAVSRQPDRAAQLRFMRTKGGTSPFAASLVVVLLLAPLIWGGYWGIYQASRLDYSAYVLDATGPLTLAEIEANFLNPMDEPLIGNRRECVFRELGARARAAGDPETLDPATTPRPAAISVSRPWAGARSSPRVLSSR